MQQSPVPRVFALGLFVAVLWLVPGAAPTFRKEAPPAPERRGDLLSALEVTRQVAGAVPAWLREIESRASQPWTVGDMIRHEAARHKLDPLLIETIVKFESAGNPAAVSWVGAQGLMQLMPETAAEMGVTDPTDPEQNIAGGTRYFALMMRKFGDPRLALAAYNAGPGAVQRYNGIPPYRETRNYVRNIYGEYRWRALQAGRRATGWAS